MKGERAEHGPHEDVWAVYRLLCRCDSNTGSGNEWAPLTAHGVEQACKLFGLHLTQEELGSMFAAPRHSSEARRGSSMSLPCFARIIGRAPWF